MTVIIFHVFASDTFNEIIGTMPYYSSMDKRTFYRFYNQNRCILLQSKFMKTFHGGHERWRNVSITVL